MSDDLIPAPEVHIDTERALARLRARIENERIVPVRRVAPSRRRASLGPWSKGLAVAATVALVATVLTVSGVAESILVIFEPKQVAAVPITMSDLKGGPSLTTYGALVWSAPPRPVDVPDLRAATSESGLTVLTPATLPGPNLAAPRYGVMPLTTATFTFSAEKTKQAAAQQGRTPPPMPANIDGSRLFITGGPAVVTVWDDGTKPSGNTQDPFAALPKLMVAQGKGPVVRSDGVTVEQLQSYLLAQPGITPQLAAQIRAIKDPSSTLPIPVPVDYASSKKVTVQGTDGVFIGDSTGLGSAVIWQKGGIVYGVAGRLTEAECLAVANSLR